MADKTLIQWSDATWNPITGCSIVSSGCKNCYAMGLAARRLRNHPSRQGLTDEHGRWTGEVRWNEQWLDQPLRWKRPRRIFVCAHSDLFHENVPSNWIDTVFAVMALAPQHQFQVLTKRPERMRDYLRGAPVDRGGFRSIASRDSIIVEAIRGDQANGRLPGSGLDGAPWPLPNVWLGTSVEDQPTFDRRVKPLRECPAAVRWLSVEPLLGPINAVPLGSIDWIVVGGESGPGYRPMDPEWARSLRDQCVGAGVPFYMKQMAGKKPIPPDLLVREWPR